MGPSHISVNTQQHLIKVYTSMGLGMLSAAVGAVLNLLYLKEFMLISVVVSIGSLISLCWLHFTHGTKDNELFRFALLQAMCFGMGHSTGFLLDFVLEIDPSLIPTAFMGTCVIFVSLTLSALYNKNKTYLQIGGLLLSCLLILTLLGLLNIFMGSMLLYNIRLYGGLIMFCGWMLYDTQSIIEKFNHGDTDYIMHATDLFINFVQIFQRLLVIMAGNAESKKKKK